MRRAAALAGVVLLASCAGASQEEQGAKEEVPSSTTTAPAGTATTAAPAPTTTSAPAVASFDPCRLLDRSRVARAGFSLDPEPQRKILRREDSADAAATLAKQDMDGIYHCDASFPVGLLVWDAVTPAVAAKSLDESLRDSADTPGAQRYPLPGVERGGIVIDTELENSTAQWKNGDRHLVLNLTNYKEESGLAPAGMRGLLTELVAFAQQQL